MVPLFMLIIWDLVCLIFVQQLKAAGNTLLEVIASVILMDAKSRLKSSNEPVKNIALSLGFNNISFFNKFLSSIPASLRRNTEGTNLLPVSQMEE